MFRILNSFGNRKENNKMVELKLGMKVKDNVTGAVGTITAIAKYLYGEPQFLFEYLNVSGSICSSWFPADRYTILND